MKRKAAAVLMLLGMAVGIWACGSHELKEEEKEEPEQITLNVWHQWTNDTNELKKIYGQAVEAYMQEHKNIVIQTHTLDTEAYKMKMSAEFSGSAEDIDVFYYWGNGMAKKLVYNDKLLPLDDYITDSVREKLLPESTAAFEYGGYTYSLPSFSWYLTMFCNQDIFDAAGAKLPETYEELLDAVHKINEMNQDVIPIASGARDGWNLALVYQAFAMREVGADNVNRMLRKEIPFQASDGYESAAEKMVELYQVNAFGHNSLGESSDEANLMFVRGDAAMRITGSWFANQIYTDSSVKINPAHVVAMKIPMIDGKGKETDYVGGFVESFWVNKNTEHAKEAAEFAVYINEAMGNGAYQSGSGFSGWTTKDSTSELNPLFLQIEDFMLQGETGVLAWDTALDTYAATVHNEQVQKLCTSRADVGTFIKMHEDAINKK